MKCIAPLIVCFLLCFGGCTGNGTRKPDKNSTTAADSLGGDFSVKTNSIVQKKQEMQAVSDTTYNFVFSEDWKLKDQDPHAFWLMNRMMQTVPIVGTADDNWAWMLAMNDCVTEYNSRLGRKIGSVEAATLAVEELIDIYDSGTQRELNIASSVHSILEIYRTTYRYKTLIDHIHEKTLRELYRREYQAWFDLNDAQNGIMSYYTYAAAHYSALPMDLNGTSGYWSKKRCEELEIESDIIDSWERKSFNSDSTAVSKKKFDKLLRFFDGRTEENIIKEATSDAAQGEDESANSDCCEEDNIDKTKKCVRLYEAALTQWCRVREDIALSLPTERQKSYREITKQVHARFYNDLNDLARIRY